MGLSIKNKTLLLVLQLVSSHMATALWVTGYLPGWTQYDINAASYNFTGVTHIMHFALTPTTTGGIDTDSLSLIPAHVSSAVSVGHAAGAKVFVTVGGEGTQASFQAATSPANVAKFVNNLVAFAVNNGYDGLDIDWEPISSGDISQFTNFVNLLRQKMSATNPNLKLFGAFGNDGVAHTLLGNGLHQQFDQINLMTYVFSGPWPGWVTWHDSCLYNGGNKFPSIGGYVPSGKGIVDMFIQAGVPAAKIGLGMEFQGAVWQGGSGVPLTGGVTKPLQTWVTEPTLTYKAYKDIMAQDYTAAKYFYDTAAEGAYLSFDNTGSANDRFITYENERQVTAKVDYAKKNGLGGVMIWELSQDKSTTMNQPLLNAVVCRAFSVCGGTTPPTTTATPTTTTKPTTTTPLPPPPPPPSTVWIVRDSLLSPWIVSSWSVSTSSGMSTTQKFNGTSSMKIIETAAWAAFSVHSGKWEAPVVRSASAFSGVSFAVFTTSTTLSLNVLLEDDAGSQFPSVALGKVVANKWKVYTAPMAALNPKKKPFTRVDIMDISGTGGKVFYVDEMRLVAA
eukprot:comp23573_c0_seq1/m.39925 comp23573_c0_seq1/g.39925  ORF comp23573_c0_seq1/g.39925 comp23573_c0_seq1/m.39925 type:complete len:562 (-) comp23573_c0_seq1:416-2101(-)